MEQLSQEVLQRLWAREAAPDLHAIAQEYGATAVLGAVTVACILVIYALVRLHSWLKGSVCEHTVDLTGKNVVVTGGNTGIGRATAARLAQMGANVVLACRTAETAEKAVQSIIQQTGNRAVSWLELDLASLDSVRRFAAAYRSTHRTLDILINNAGVMDAPFSRTKDGFELHFGCNHLGHFLLTHELMPLLESTPHSRVVTVASNSHIFCKGLVPASFRGDPATYYRRWAYAQSKLANILFTCDLPPSRQLGRPYLELYSLELDRQLKERGSRVLALTLHPGVVNTEILRHWPALVRAIVELTMPLWAKNAEQGAQTTIHAAIAPGLERHGGAYLAECAVRQASKAGRDKAAARMLWEMSEELVGLAPGSFFAAPAQGQARKRSPARTRASPRKNS